jgi:hypothetical protein
MHAAHDGAMLTDHYEGVTLGVECAWPTTWMAALLAAARPAAVLPSVKPSPDSPAGMFQVDRVIA